MTEIIKIDKYFIMLNSIISVTDIEVIPSKSVNMFYSYSIHLSSNKDLNISCVLLKDDNGFSSSELDVFKLKYKYLLDRLQQSQRS